MLFYKLSTVAIARFPQTSIFLPTLVNLKSAQTLRALCTNKTASNSQIGDGEEATVAADSGSMKSGFALAFDKHTKAATNKPEEIADVETFASLLRKSKFIDLGDAEGKVVSGKIFHVVGDDLSFRLYISIFLGRQSV